MSTLSELFDEHRDQLYHRISIDPRPEKVTREVKDFLGPLLKAHGKDKERSLTERRLSGFILDLLNASISTLAACAIDVSRQEQPPSSSTSSPAANGRDLLWRAAQIAIAVTLLGSLLQAGAFTSVALLLVVVAVESKNWFLADPRVPPLVLSAPSVLVNVDAFLVRLREAIRVTDTVLAEFVKPISPSVSSVENDSALLELFQELLHALYSEDAAFALKQAKLLPFLLEQHGIRAENLREGNGHLFDFVPSLDPGSQGQRTLSPALVKRDGQLLKRGLATQPAPKETKDLVT